MVKKNGTDMDISEMLKVMLKCVLHNSYMLRQVTGSLWLAFLADVDEPVAAGLLAEGVSYNETVKAEGKGHNRGAPHIHLAVRAVEGMAASEVIAKTPQMADAAKLLKAKYAEAPGAVVADHFLHIRAKRCRKRGEEPPKAIITLAVSSLAMINIKGSDIPLQTVLLKLIDELQRERKYGPPPRNELERALEVWLGRV